jgi:hypothetical protein
MIRYTTGNLLDAPVEALVNTVNTVGVMGKGIALMFKERFPANMRAEALLQLLSGQYKLEPILKTLEPATAQQLQSEWRDIQAKLTQQEAELKNGVPLLLFSLPFPFCRHHA